MFFEVFQTCVNDLLHAKHLAAKQIPDIVDVPICIGKTNINRSCKIVQPQIIDQNADQYGDRGESGCGKRRHQLFASVVSNK